MVSLLRRRQVLLISCPDASLYWLMALHVLCISHCERQRLDIVSAWAVIKGVMEKWVAANNYFHLWLIYGWVFNLLALQFSTENVQKQDTKCFPQFPRAQGEVFGPANNSKPKGVQFTMIYKTGILQYRGESMERGSVAFHFGWLMLSFTDQYKYRGLTLDEHMLFKGAVSVQAQSVGRALGSALNNVKQRGNLAL